MAQQLSAGIFIEEVASSNHVIQAVSTSNLGIIGFTPMGPSNTATLITSFNQYNQVFGGLSSSSLTGHQISAFFSNGGSRAFVVRVVPSNAVAASAFIQSQISNQQIEVGDDTTEDFIKSSSLSVLRVNGGASPIEGETIDFRWRGNGLTPVTNGALKKRDGVTTAVADSTSLHYELRVAPAVIPAVDPGLFAIIPYTTTLHWVVGVSTAKSIAIPPPSSGFIATATSADASVSLDLRTGFLSATFTAAPVPAAHPPSDFSLDYTPATATFHALGAKADPLGRAALTGSGLVNNGGLVTGTSATISTVVGSTVTLTGLTGMIPGMVGSLMTISGAFTPSNNGSFYIAAYHSATSVDITNALGALDAHSGSLVWASGSLVNCETGAYAFATGTGAEPHLGGPILASYAIDAWTVNPISQGVWGNNLRVDVSGSPNYYVAATNSYSLFNVNVMLANSNGVYQVVETYEELNFNDPTSSVFFADVINDLSSYITIVEPAGNVPPGQLSGIPITSLVLAGGDTSSIGRVISTTLPPGAAGVGPRSVTISWTDASATPHTIRDDGAGNLTGDIDASGTNTINYASGALVVTLLGPSGIAADSFVTVTYAEAPVEQVHTELLGDSTKFYTVGSDGTFDSAHFSRAQFTSPSLQPSYQGLYALDRIDELMQVIVPDFAGDPTVTEDLIAYASERSTQPSGGDRFLILTTPKGKTAQGAVDWFRYSLGQYSTFGALYWPWVTVADPLSNGRNLIMPPLGHIAGIYARTDATKNVGKSPGGTIDGALVALTGLEYAPTQGDRDYVYPNKINPLISSTQTGLAVWGVRTISVDSTWRYVNARRLFMFLEKSIYNATFWIVFENNGPALWAKIKTQLNGFLGNLFTQGYFAGSSPSQAYSVICDSTNNTQATIDAGQVIIDVAVAPNIPAEFVVFRFTQLSSS